MSEESRCPVTGKSPGPTAGGGTRNMDWWPNQLDLGILHQNSPASNPPAPEFDLLLTDYVLPDGSGTDIARDLRERWPALRVIGLAVGTGGVAGRGEVLLGAVHLPGADQGPPQGQVGEGGGQGPVEPAGVGAQADETEPPRAPVGGRGILQFGENGGRGLLAAGKGPFGRRGGGGAQVLPGGVARTPGIENVLDPVAVQVEASVEESFGVVGGGEGGDHGRRQDRREQRQAKGEPGAGRRYRPTGKGSARGQGGIRRGEPPACGTVSGSFCAVSDHVLPWVKRKCRSGSTIRARDVQVG